MEQTSVRFAQTGTGKTIAYLLPLLNQRKFSKTKEPQILVLVPTRELVTQVVDAVKSLTLHLNLSAIAIGVYGGVNINTQRLELQNGCDIGSYTWTVVRSGCNGCL